MTQLLKLIIPFMAMSGHFKSLDGLGLILRKVLLQAFRKCIIYEVLNVRSIVKLAIRLTKKHFFDTLHEEAKMEPPLTLFWRMKVFRWLV